MKSIEIGCVLLFFTSILTLVACDNGMAIQAHWNRNPSAPITFTDQSRHVLIGENWFAPQLRVQNLSDAEVEISSIELNVAGRTYKNERGRSESYPVTVKPHDNTELPVWFELGDQSVYKLFYNKRGELQVRYRVNGMDALITAEVSGGPMSTNR